MSSTSARRARRLIAKREQKERKRKEKAAASGQPFQFDKIQPSYDWVSWGQGEGPKEVELPEEPGFRETPEALDKIASNRWETNLDEVIEFIKKASMPIEEAYEADGNTLKPGCIDWSWARNFDCKYVNLRFDMRDGAFTIVNGEGERISLDALKWQYKGKDE